MRIVRVEIEGYKNFIEPVVLHGLGPIVTIHGDNGSGKSNLLEALAWPFRLLSQVLRGTPMSVRTDGGTMLGVPLVEIQPLGHRGATRFTVEVVACPPNDGSVTITAVLRPEGDLTVCDVDVTLDGAQVDLMNATTEQRQALLHVVTPGPGTGLHHLDPWRRLMPHVVADRSGQLSVHASPLVDLLIDQQALLALFDARESRDVARRKLLEAFRQAAAPFLTDMLGQGRLEVSFDRARNVAWLGWERSDGIVPSHLMGSGARQLLATLAIMVVQPAAIWLIDEPEIHLRVSRHAQFARAIEGMVSSTGGQVFLASHSPHFESSGHVHLRVERAAQGASVRPSRAPQASSTHHDAVAFPPSHGSVRAGWCSEEGMIVLPPASRESLQVLQGGPIGILAGESGVERLLRYDLYLDELERVMPAAADDDA